MLLGVVFICLAVALPAAQALPSGAAAAESSNQISLLNAVNRVRAAHGLRPLAVDAALTEVARSHSARILRSNSFSHGSFGTRLARSGARGPTYGENLAWGTGSRTSPRAIVSSWLASPGHRANLLRPGFRRIGIGARIGSFAGRRGALVVTADFAGR